MSAFPQTSTQHDPSGGQLVAIDGRTLPLEATKLRTDARGGIARVVLEQTFQNPYDEVLSVTYQVPLPSDGAVSGYAFRIGDRRIVGEVDRRESARERFEDAILSGRSAALLDQDRSSLFTQEIGNIPPGAEIVAELTIDQKLRFLPEGSWEWRFPTVVAPRYLGAEGRVPDVDRVSVDVADGELDARVALELAIGDTLVHGKNPDSPSHPIVIVERGGVLVGLAADAELDRDIVVRWPVAAAQVGTGLDLARPPMSHAQADKAYGLLTVTPPVPEHQPTRVARDLIFLIDTSGSMHGEPLDQAKRVMSAMVDSLGDHDQLEMIEFSSAPRKWRRSAAHATAKTKRDALKWIAKRSAGGGTEMRSGILEALAPLRAEAQRQIVLISDGLIGFESEIVAAILEKLPAGSRLHTVGVGSAVNRSLTGPAARAGRGAEVVIGIGEDPERACQRLLARTDAPLVVNLELEGDAVVGQAPERLPDLFGGSPALISVALRPEGGTLVVRGDTETGVWEQRLDVGPTDSEHGNPAVIALYARERVEDHEMHAATGMQVDEPITKLGLDFQITTRLTSFVAIDDKVSVDPNEPSRREKIPHALPYGMSVEGLGLRAAGMARVQSLTMAGIAGAPPAAAPPPPQARARYAPPAPKSEKKKIGRFVGDLVDRFARTEAPADLEADDGFEVAEDAAMAERAAPRRLAGEIVRAKPGELIVRIRVEDEALDWDPEDELEVELEDGTRVTIEVDLGRTTRAGTVEPGRVIRLVLLPSGDGAVPRALVLDDDLVVTLPG